MPTSQSNPILENLDTCRLSVLISPDGVTQFRVVKQLVTSEQAVTRPQLPYTPEALVEFVAIKNNLSDFAVGRLRSGSITRTLVK
jgi:hypothetical protein